MCMKEDHASEKIFIAAAKEFLAFRPTPIQEPSRLYSTALLMPQGLNLY